MPESVSKTFDELQASLPLLPTGTPQALGLIAFSKPSELATAIEEVDRQLTTAQRQSEGVLVEQAKEQYETALDTIGKHGQLDIRDARDNIELAKQEQQDALSQLPHAGSQSELGKQIHSKRARLSRPVTWPIAAICVAALAFAGKESSFDDRPRAQRNDVPSVRLTGAVMGGTLGGGVAMLVTLGAGGHVARVRAKRQIKSRTQSR